MFIYTITDATANTSTSAADGTVNMEFAAPVLTGAWEEVGLPDAPPLVLPLPLPVVWLAL